MDTFTGFSGISDVKFMQTILNGRNPTYIITWKVADEYGTSYPLLALIGNQDNLVWLSVNFDDTSGLSDLTVHTILNSIQPLQGNIEK
jgi:hypothetical protein